ncbi:MAG TPA: hypothetical protein VF189_01860 [Patescibacteria group bacterium]
MTRQEAPEVLPPCGYKEARDGNYLTPQCRRPGGCFLKGELILDSPYFKTYRVTGDVQLKQQAGTEAGQWFCRFAQMQQEENQS